MRVAASFLMTGLVKVTEAYTPIEY